MNEIKGNIQMVFAGIQATLIEGLEAAATAGKQEWENYDFLGKIIAGSEAETVNKAIEQYRTGTVDEVTKSF